MNYRRLAIAKKYIAHRVLQWGIERIAVICFYESGATEPVKARDLTDREIKEIADQYIAGFNMGDTNEGRHLDWVVKRKKIVS